MRATDLTKTALVCLAWILATSSVVGCSEDTTTGDPTDVVGAGDPGTGDVGGLPDGASPDAGGEPDGDESDAPGLADGDEADTADPADADEPDADEPDAGDAGLGDAGGPDATDGGPTDADDAGADDVPDEGADSEPPVVLGEYVRFETPVDGGFVTETVDVRIAPVGVEELLLDDLFVYVNDELVFRDSKAPTAFRYDTRAAPPGPIEMRLEANAGFDSGTDIVTLSAGNPSFDFVKVTAGSPVVQNGVVASLLVDMDQQDVPLTADFSAIDSNYVAGDEASYSVGGTSSVITHVISPGNLRPDGVYTIPITAKFGIAEVVYTHATLELLNKAELPLAPEAGIDVAEPLPVPSAGWGAPAPVVVIDNEAIVTGGSTTMTVDYTQAPLPEDVVGVLIGTESGTRHVVLPIEGGNGVLEIPMLMRSFFDGEIAPDSLSLRVSYRDRQGRVSPRAAVVLDVVQVGNGDVQVSLSWDTATDVDLHVVEPGGCELYYGNRNCDSGGELDLDSNAACSIDGVNNENVYWPAGGAPFGAYSVRVNFWGDCCDCGADYTVTLNFCGFTQIVQGKLLPGTSTGGGQGSGTEVAQFSNVGCKSVIRGRARYQDRAFDEEGFAAWTWKPVRYAVVELRRLSDGVVIGEGVTDRNGDYEIGYTNEGPPGLAVTVKAMTDAETGIRDLRVRQHPKFPALYEVTSPPVIEVPGSNEPLIADIDVLETQKAGAFNILDELIEAHDAVRVATGRDLATVDAFWATGADTTETIYCSPYFYGLGVCTELGAMSVQGKDEDRDEYDDMVIQKEFFKLAVDRLTRDDHPGGEFDGTRDDPRRAWTEGASTWFAATLSRSRYYVDSRPLGVYVVEDLETQSSPFAFETSDGTDAGDLSPYLVSALLWDLVDGADGASAWVGDAEIFDQVTDVRAVLDTIFHGLGHDAWVDAGVEGVDLIDFLDAWRCRGWGQDAQVQALTTTHRKVNYSAPTDLTPCVP